MDSLGSSLLFYLCETQIADYTLMIASACADNHVFMFHVFMFRIVNNGAYCTFHHPAPRILPLRIVWTLHPCDYRFYITYDSAPTEYSKLSNVSDPEEPNNGITTVGSHRKFIAGVDVEHGPRASYIIATHRCGAEFILFLDIIKHIKRNT